MKKTSNKPVKKEISLEAVPIVPGMAMGPVFQFRRFSFNIEDLDYTIQSISAEIERFRAACKKTSQQLRKTQQMSSAIYDDEFLEIFESQVALLEDEIFLQEIENRITENQCSAAYAVFTVFHEKMDHFMGMDNEYFRDRALDIQDLKHKILHAIFGIGTEYQISIPSVIFADYLSPSDTIHFNRNLILGIVTDTGGKTSHAAIVARSLNLPYIINDNSLSKIVQKDDFVIIDAYRGKVIINPQQKTLRAYLQHKSKYNQIELSLKKDSALPATTLDDVHVDVYANVEFVHEIKDVHANGASGIGLFRTEGIFLEKEKLPGEEEQYRIYKQFSEEMKGMPVLLRTLDAGGDKILKDIDHPQEQNPFLGWRAIRFCIDEKAIFKTQLRAILRANKNGNIQILIPMISCLGEITETKQIIEEVKSELKAEGRQFYPDTAVGIMVEIPSAALMSDMFAREIDFMSIGTNDLTQYTLAVDRTNQKIARLFNDMHPAVLRLMQTTIRSARENGIEISLCGEMAANPEAVPVLLGLGLRKLSISPFMIPRIKKVIRHCRISECETLVAELLRLPSAAEIDAMASQFFKSRISNSNLII